MEKKLFNTRKMTSKQSLTKQIEDLINQPFNKKQSIVK